MCELHSSRPDGASETTSPLGVLGARVLAYVDHRWFRHINQFRSKFHPDRSNPLYVLRSHRVVTPGVVRSLTELPTEPAG